MKHKIIVWFRQDLRLLDNPAMYEASQDGVIIPVYIKEDQIGSASAWWLDLSLRSFKEKLDSLGANLILKKGNPHQVLKELASRTGATAVYFNNRYEPHHLENDKILITELKEHGVHVNTFHTNLLFEPGSIRNKQGNPYKVFTSFWKTCKQIPVQAPLPVPANINWDENKIESCKLEELELVSATNWHQKLEQYWEPGEDATLKKWRTFAEVDIHDYLTYRNDPVLDATSLLSPHLAFGEISPRLIWHESKELEELSEIENLNEEQQESVEGFLRQLVWRDFAYHQLVDFPHIVDKPLQQAYLSFPWNKVEEDTLEAWKKGQTGYPLIDAGMRELWETGWMHNRVRMVVGSFLVKHLLYHWKEGSAWFEDTLVDADLANNTMGWQWVAGTGFDSSPFFRIFNPIKQAERFDPDGTYIKKWLPELRLLPGKYLVEPWKAPTEILENANIKIGVDYPEPIVEHDFARKRALSAYQQMKEENKNA
ncbi:cryptochrome/photolyase family protein [Saliterribacillus persicus]|uniref:Deoxyribodipyrimidine photo-lyase n=1 Tax=Saliterribacillus persicus TaxID=930114 RepID=A0A368YD86_9BACI|nr:deoxyribodipyrimidine photo-lyase [Saliterribacillus persicus]RCW76837.1 deoxyribodipyrimidine photo-lyase type I [Saliterribacillus persicus]